MEYAAAANNVHAYYWQLLHIPSFEYFSLTPPKNVGCYEQKTQSTQGTMNNSYFPYFLLTVKMCENIPKSYKQYNFLILCTMDNRSPTKGSPNKTKNCKIQNQFTGTAKNLRYLGQRYLLNISTWRKRGVTSNPLFIICTRFFLAFFIRTQLWLPQV